MAARKLAVVAVAVLAVVAGVLEGLELCNMNDDGFNECRPSVTQPNPVAPSLKCCQAVSAANLTCLCGFQNSYLLPYVGIDPALAKALPPKCNLTLPADC